MFDQDKTEQPTPKRRREARLKGQVARSQDLTTSVLLLLSVIMIRWSGKSVGSSILGYCRSFYAEKMTLSTDLNTLTQQMTEPVYFFLSLFTFFLGVLLTGGIGTNLLQSGWLFLPEKIIPDFQRINPLVGFQRIFSSEGAVRTGLGLFKILLCFFILYQTVKSHLEPLLNISQSSVAEIIIYLFDFLTLLLFYLAIVFVLLAGLDYLYQYWRLEKDLQMTPQEIREELREMTGSPQVQARHRQLRQEILTGKLKQSANAQTSSGEFRQNRP